MGIAKDKNRLAGITICGQNALQAGLSADKNDLRAWLSAGKKAFGRGCLLTGADGWFSNRGEAMERESFAEGKRKK